MAIKDQISEWTDGIEPLPYELRNQNFEKVFDELKARALDGNGDLLLATCCAIWAYEVRRANRKEAALLARLSTVTECLRDLDRQIHEFAVKYGEASFYTGDSGAILDAIEGSVPMTAIEILRRRAVMTESVSSHSAFAPVSPEFLRAVASLVSAANHVVSDHVRAAGGFNMNIGTATLRGNYAWLARCVAKIESLTADMSNG